MAKSPGCHGYQFHALQPMTVAAAVQVFQRPARRAAAGSSACWWWTTQEASQDALGLRHLPPAQTQSRRIWGKWPTWTSGLLKAACDRARPVLVDIMTTELITITPDAHLLLIINIMI